MIETATRRRRIKRALQDIPEFQNHLRLKGIGFAAWEDLQSRTAGMQTDTDALNLARRKLNLNRDR